MGLGDQISKFAHGRFKPLISQSYDEHLYPSKPELPPGLTHIIILTPDHTYVHIPSAIPHLDIQQIVANAMTPTVSIDSSIGGVVLNHLRIQKLLEVDTLMDVENELDF